MYSRMDKYHGQKVQRFSIRKYSFGAASVAVAAYMMFGGAATVQAQEPGTSATVTSEQVNSDAGNQADSTKPVASTETSTSTVEAQTAEQLATSAPEAAPAETPKAAEAPAETPKAAEAPTETPKADTSKLEAAIARLEAALAKAASTEKTASAIESAKAALASAKAVVANEAATKEEVAKATSAVNGKAFVIESMPKATADKKEEKQNQDSRNGQAIPGNGESGFREAAGTTSGTNYREKITALNAELTTEIEKIKVEITKEESLGEGKKNKEKLDILKAIVNKAEEVKRNATNTSTNNSETEQNLQAEWTKIKQEKDKLGYYLSRSENWGAPINNNKAGYGNNPANGVFENLKNGFGEMDFTGTSVESKSKTIEDQVNNLQSGKHYGKVTYHWKTKKITATDAENGMLNGWKIGGTKDYIHAVKPEEPTDYTLGTERTEKPKSAKAYDNNGKITTTTATQEQPNASGKFLGGLPTLDGMKNPYKGSVANRDYYLELGSKGVTLSKEYDVNPNSQLFFNLIHNGAYGKAALSSEGEEVKVEVTDAYTGKKIASVPMKNGQAPETATNRPAGSGYGTPADGWNNLLRLFAIPEGTSRVKITITANDDGQFKGVEDGFLIGGVGVATGPGMQLTSNVTSNGKTGEYGYTKDKLYKRSQEGKLNLELKNVGGMENTFPYGGTFNIKVKVPEGVELGTVSETNYKKLDLSKASGESIWTDQGYLTNVRYDAATRTLSMNLNAVQYGKNNLQATGKTSRKFSIPFITKDDYVGDATFEVSGTGGFGGVDAEGNSLYSWKINGAGGMYSTEENYNSNGLRWSDNPDYHYNRTIYIDARKPKAPTVEEIHTDRIVGDKKDNNQEKYLLVSTGDTVGSLTPTEEQIKENILRVAKNNGVTLSDNELSEKVAEIKKNFELENEVGKKINITLPDNKKIELVKKDDGWYRGDNKLELIDGKLKVTLADDINLHGLAGVDKIAVTATSPVGNDSDVANSNIVNDAPTVAVTKNELYVYKTKEADKWNNDKVLEKAKPSATDLEDDRDGVDSTKPTIAVSDAGNLDTTKVGNYTVKVQSTDSEGKKSTEADVTVHVLDLIKVDPTVTTDPTNPSTTAPVSPKTADTPVKEGDENLGKYPAGLTREDLVKEVTRTIKYLKEEDADKADATPLYAEKVQKVTYKRTATVNPETKEVTYSDWEVYNEADKLTDATVDETKGKFNAVDSPVVDNYLLVNATDKTVAEKEAPVPGGDGTVTPEVVKVLYKEIGSFSPKYPEGKKPNGAQDKIPYPNNPTDPTVPGDFSTITIPYVPGYTPVYNGQELTPKNPNDPTQGYKVPDGFTPTDKFGESPITYTPSTQTAKVVIEKKVDGSANEVVSSVDLTGKSGSELPASTDIDNKIKELKNQGYEVESDEYHIQDNHHPTFDDKEDINAQDGTPAPSQTFKIVVKPRIIEVPSSTPHEKDSPVDPNGENPDLKWPEGLAESDLNTTVKRVISYVKKDSDTAPEEKAKDDIVQTVPFTRKAKVNLVTKIVTYTDWEATNKTWDKVGVDVLPGYIADKKEIPAKEVATPAKDTKVIPDETDKVTYTKIGSWIPVDPTTGKDGEPIPFPNNPNDPTKTGEITQIIPHKEGYTPKDGNGTPLEPVNPANPEQGYKPPKITDPKANIKITYEKDDQKAKVKFVSIDPKTQTETELTDHALTLTGKSGETIPESDVQTHIDVLKSMGYDIVDNPFDKDPAFDTKKDTNDNITQEFTIKVQPRVSTAKTVYVVEGDKLSAEKVKDAVATEGNQKTVDETKIPETTGKVGDDTLTAPVTVTYGSGDKKREEIVNVPVKVVQGYQQIVPVDEGKKQPSPEDSLDTDDYPDDATFEYKEEVDTSTPGDKKVTVVVKQGDKVLVEVPATVRVVESYPQFVPVDKDNKQPAVEGSIDPKAFPKETEFSYETPVDTTTPGEKDVVVVAKIGDKVIAKVPAKVMVVEPKTQYVPVDKSNKQPDASKSVDPEQYPDGVTFKYKTPVDTTTLGEKDVIVEAKDGEDKLVEVPAKVKVVEGKEQLIPVNPTEKPQARDSITPSDYPEGSTFEYKVPEGQKEPFDATTVGDKPVTVVVKDKNGNVLVEVPATIKVVEAKPTPIETPVTNTPLTKEDIAKFVKVPEGGKVTNVENIPDLTTPGEKDPVKVTVELPNGKIVTVEVPVNVTPIEDIVKKQGDPITAEDVEKHIPKGVKVISIGDKPTTDIPGERPSIPVVIELPNGIRVTMDIPVIVTQKVTPVVVPVGTPVTPEDVKKHIELPKGWTVTKVGEIPTTTTPGTKPVVSVEIELPDGRKITVDVPVIVTPTVRQIVVPQGTPITPDDVKGHIDLPKEPGWEIVEVGEIPTTIPAGVKPSVKVKIKVPTGEIVEVEVPIIVTPKVTPIVVEVGTPITKEDVIKKVGLPEGWEIVEVGEIPTTETPGTKPVVKVKIKLPDGRIITVEVPVTVTPKSQNGGGVISQNGDSTVQIVTEYLDENGNRITSDKEGKHNPIELEGYEFSHSTTDAKGNTLHHYKKVKKPINQEQPSSPETPTSPEKPVATPVQTSSTDSKPVAVETAEANDKKELPNTGTEANASLAALGLLGALSGFGLLARKKKED